MTDEDPDPDSLRPLLPGFLWAGGLLLLILAGTLAVILGR